jgi:hypothetical protein
VQANAPQRRPTVSSLFLRIAGGLFVIATCLRVWIGPLPVLPAAYGQIPDAGLQRKQILEESIRTNQLLSEIRLLLAEKTLNVRIAGADNSKDAGSSRN